MLVLDSAALAARTEAQMAPLSVHNALILTRDAERPADRGRLPLADGNAIAPR